MRGGFSNLSHANLEPEVLAPVPAAIELAAVSECSSVMNNNGLARFGAVAVPCLDCLHSHAHLDL